MSAKPAMNSLAQAMKDLLDERVRQVARWGVDVGKPDAAFHLVLAEEVAAVSIAWLEEINRRRGMAQGCSRCVKIAG